MRKLSPCKTAIVMFLLLAATAIAAQAQTFTTLANFDGPRGAEPFVMSLVQGVDGDFYGTTEYGGATGCYMRCGTTFRINPAGDLRVLSFCNPRKCGDGSSPLAGLVLGADGILYGATAFGGGSGCGGQGCGTVFQVALGEGITTLHRFDERDGYAPDAPLIIGIDGNFYGTTNGGGSGCSGAGCGTVFRITPGGEATTLYSFDIEDGAEPTAGLVQASDGNFYGTANSGGKHDEGTVFRITPAGRLTTLHNFCSHTGCTDGAAPFAGLIEASDGNLYGTTSNGGNGNGTVFKITPSGQFTTLHTFNHADGAGPLSGLIQATDGNLYGTTIGGGAGLCGCGTAYQITPGGILTTLHSFDGTDGYAPYGGLLQGTNGTFYGTTLEGGDITCALSAGCGTVFSLDMGLDPFVAFVFPAGRIGQIGGILGQGFTGTTNVSLNGVSAAFTVVSDTYIRATVPPGATTGYVTVTTPSGTLKSNVPFHILP